MTVPRKRLPWSLRPRSGRPSLSGRHHCRPRVEELEAYVLLAHIIQTFTVSSNTDNGSGLIIGTLSYAIDQVNGDPTDSASSPDMIAFDIDGGGAQTVSVTGALPNITKPVIIDGTTEPGFLSTPLVELNGSGLSTSNVTALTLAAGSGGSTVNDLVISNFTGDGIYLASGSDKILGNDIGINNAGLITPNQGTGIAISSGSSANTIGGTSAAAANVIANNSSAIGISGSGTTGNVVEGNYIGTDPSSHTGLGNVNGGVSISGGASGNTIGGTSAAAANVIASNGGDGVFLGDSGTTGNVVEGNFIGTDASSKTGLGNYSGMAIANGASGNTIGGTSAAAANVIASSSADGLYISSSGTTGNVVEGNFFGTDASSHTGLGNGFGGLSISGGASGNTIGGTTPGSANVIVSSVVSGADGVFLGDSGTTGNVVEGNYIGTDASSHTGLGNNYYGVVLYGGASGNTIGGTTAGARNIIASNAAGINITSTGTTGNVVEGNFIGTNASSQTGLGNGSDGVDVGGGASGNTIGGTSAGAANVIATNGFIGIYISASGTTGNVIEGNLIGTNASGASGLGNKSSGVFIGGGAGGNTIGGTSAATANVIVANGGNGIAIQGSSNNLVQGNFIGTDSSSHTGLGNSGGVVIGGGASGNTIGGTSAGGANIIVSSSGQGVFIGDSGTTGNVVEGNFIGTDSSSHTGLGNVDGGLTIANGASGNTVGGTSPSAANVIVSSVLGGADGVSLDEPGTTDNVVEGNFIGTDAKGDTGLGNGNAGVNINTDATGNTIGGTLAGTANIIASNGGDGIVVSGSGTTGNVVEGNDIGTNASSQAGLGNVNGGVSISGGASGNTIGGMAAGTANVIASNGGDSVFIGDSGTTGNVVEGNFIGTDSGSHTGLGNYVGLAIANGASGNTVGGTSAAAANVIVSSVADGLYISGTGTIGNVVEGNFIGTDASSHTGLGNGFGGLAIGGGASGNTIGGTSAGSANVITSNGGDSFFISDPGTTGNVVEGNFIGTDARSHTGLGNYSSLVITNGASGNTIGGTSAAAANVIVSSVAGGADGVSIGGTGTTSNVVEGNYIGTDSHSATGLGNAGTGVSIKQGASGNTIGGTASGAGNVIANNQGNGVTVGSSATDTSIDDAILGNSIYGNTKLGIDLGDDGVTLNDSGGHTGPNLFQDFPVLSAAEINSSGGTVITATVEGPKSSTVTVALYANPSADPSGYGQGQTFLGFVLVAIGASGTGSFSFGTTALLNTSDFVSATTTDANGNTSEFSKDQAIVLASDNVTSAVSISASGFSVNRRTLQYTQTVTITNTSGATIAGPIYLVLANLPSGVTLVSPSATPTSSANPPAGSPAIEVSSSALGINQSITVTLVFSNSGNVVINYIPEVLSDPKPL